MQFIILKKRKVNSVGTLSNTNSPSKQETEPKSVRISKIGTSAHIFKTLKANRIPRQPGIYCTHSGTGNGCPCEAEWNLNGNLYCDAHFKEQVKFNEENGIHVDLEGS
jgi:hypothetical protein